MTTTAATVDPREGGLVTVSADDETCCPLFDPAPWDGTTHVWKDRLFLKDEVHQVLHVPVDMKRVITRMCRTLTDAHAMPEAKDGLILCYDPSPWKSELLMSATREIPGAAMVRLSGTFFTKVFDGPYREAPNWLAATDASLAARGEASLKTYIHYAYCPKCAKKYGHNYGVTFAQVA